MKITGFINIKMEDLISFIERSKQVKISFNINLLIRHTNDIALIEEITDASIRLQSDVNKDISTTYFLVQDVYACKGTNTKHNARVALAQLNEDTKNILTANGLAKSVKERLLQYVYAHHFDKVIETKYDS